MVLGMFAGLPMTASAVESIVPVSISPEVSTIPISSKPAAFSDITGHWAKPALEAAVTNGLLSGWDGKIWPENNLKRAEMAAIINRAFGTVEKASLSSFTDVPSDQWYYGDMAKAVKMSAFGGYAGKLNPEADITRQDAFVALARALKLTTSDYSSLNKFSDNVQVASYAKPYMAALVSGGYIAGSGGKLNPEAYITRGEFAQVINNTIKGYIKAAGTYTEAAAGNLMVNMPGVTLKDITVSGDLIIGDGVGAGEVTLDNVKVSGRMIVRGGGKNSVRIVNNSEIAGTVIVDNKNGEVRIYTDEGVTIQKLEAGEKVILEGNFKDVTVVGDGANVQVNGKVEKVVVSAPEAKIEVSAGSTVTKIETTKDAAGIEIKVAQGATVSTIVAAAAGTTITGDGEIKVVEAKANDVAVSTGNTTVMADSGVTGVTAGGKAVQGGTESRTGPTGTGSTTGGSSGGGSSTVSATAPSSASVSVSKGSIDFDYSFYNGATTISYNQMLGAPYYLDLNASTVTIANDDPMQPFSSPAISLASLGITDGSSEFQDLDEMSTDMNYQVGAVGVGIPQKIKLSLKSKTIVDGKTVSNPWTYDTGWIAFTPAELNIFDLYGAVQGVMVKDENGMPITGENLRNITGNLRLDTDDGMMGVGATIAWSSSNPSVIDSAGQVTFPVDTPANVTLTATVSYQGLSETIAFEVTVIAVDPSDADLSNIEITGGGTLSPAFSGGGTGYTVDLHGMSATCIGIRATVRSSVYRSLNFDGDSAASGAVYYKTLSVGDNIIPITVTAQDNTQKTYVLTVNRPAVTSAASAPGEFYLDGTSDLDLYDDVRDLQITFFGAADESKIGEYRVLLARSVADFVYADALDSSCYVAVQPSGAPSYTATFSQGARDVSGNPIVTGTEYYIAFLAVANGIQANANVLSENNDTVFLYPYMNVDFVNTTGGDNQFRLSAAEGDYTPTFGDGTIDLLLADGQASNRQTFPGCDMDMMLRLASGVHNEAGDQITLASGGSGLFAITVSGGSSVDGLYGIEISNAAGIYRTVAFEVYSTGVLVKDFMLAGSGSGFSIQRKSSGDPGSNYSATFASGSVNLLDGVGGRLSEQQIAGSSFAYRIGERPSTTAGDQVTVTDDGQGVISVTVTDGGSVGSTNGEYSLQVRDVNNGRFKFIRFTVTGGTSVQFRSGDKELK